jgi:putative resolvase
MEFPHKPSETGKKRKKLQLSDHQEENDFIVENPLKNYSTVNPNPENEFVMQENQAIIKDPHLIDKSNYLEPSIQDIGSGLNWKRKGFMEILDGVYEKTISEVVVFHKDRLCRFGFELVEFIMEKAGTKLLVHDKIETTTETNEKSTTKYTSPEQELAEDLLSIVTVFVARNNGKRSNGYKKRAKKSKMEPKDETSKQEKKGKRDPMKDLPKKAKKILMIPTTVQKKILNEWFHTARWIYNQCLAIVKEKGIEYLDMSKLRGSNL